jgi:hypothetical protein
MKQKKGAIVKQSKDGEVQKLKNRIKKLEKDKRILISKLNTAEKALEHSERFLKGSTEEFSVEELIDAANKSKTLKEVKDTKCPKCGGSELKVMVTLFGTLSTCECGFSKKEMK